MEYTVGGGRKQILLTILIITSALSHPKRLVLHNSKSLPLLRNRNLGRLTVRQSLRGGRKQPSLYSREFGRRKGAIHCSINENADATPTIQAPETQLGQDLKLDLLKLSLSEMENLMSSFGEPKFRAKQLHKAIFDTRIQSFSEMSALPTKVREKLERAATIGSLKIAKEQDGTIKRAYALHDDRLIESVLMPYDDGRYTACISSQAGCAQGCVFCATGQMGFGRHLSSDEIFEQAFRFSQELQQEGKRLSNVVFMGMGEPFANYDNVINALNRIHGTLNIGIVPKIYEFADMNSQVTLAVSLHCANDEKRGDLMPVNRRWSVAELIQACRYYVFKTNRRITFEWASIAGENDSKDDAKELAALLRGLKCHVNVIPVNPTAGYPGKASKASAKSFVEDLNELGIPATLRVRRGIDIDGGCGQLTVRMSNELIDDPNDVPNPK